MSLFKAMQNLKFDKRLAERHITTGTMTEAEWNQHLQKLPDMAHNVDVLDMEKVDADADVDAIEQH